MADEDTLQPDNEINETEEVATSEAAEAKEQDDSAADEMVDEQQTEFGKIRIQRLEQEMEKSYLDYAMSVIVARALPDVRDGLKPVHRRVLYAMWDTGLKSTAKYRKCAAVVGEVLKSYHPHGDIAVYDTLVRMAQSFSMRYPMVDGQGNFGSIDGDSAAAMRYTEARMAAVAEGLLVDIEKDTVNFIPNYDGETTEPTVLPARVPNLLLNGALGIAVGMATNIPPHNLTELCQGIIHLADNPEASIDDLNQFIKGPDFPTGGLIFNTEDIKNAYATGKGRIVMRGVADIVEQPRGYQIIISAIPFQVNKAELVTKIADLVKDKKIEGISDLRDESDREEHVRIVVELKQTAFPKKILNQLYALTPLESAFHVNMLALVDGIQPRVLNLKQVLEEYLKHRVIVVRRRTEYDLARAKERAHILEGLKIALDHIDEVIETIRKSANRDAARTNLMDKFELSEPQANAILDMRLSALAALERQRVEDELKEKLALIAELEAILASEERILTIIKDELNEIMEKFGDERRTQIIPHGVTGFRAEDLIPNEQVIVTITSGGYIKRVPAATYRSQNRGGKGIVGMGTKEEDVVEHLISTWTHNDLLLFTDRGRLFVAKVYDLPAASRQAKGQAMPNIIQIAPDEKVTTVLSLDKNTRAEGKYFFMGTEKGIVKKTLIEAYANVRKTGIIAIKLRDGDTLRWVALTAGEDRVMLVSHSGQAILFKETDVRPMGRSASGVTGMRLRAGDKVMAMTIIPASLVEPPVEETKKRGRKPDGPMLLTVVENGYGKRTPIDEFRGQRRGGIGVRAARTTPKTGKVITAMVMLGDQGDLVLVSKQGVVLRIPLRSAKKLGRDAQGVTLMRFKGANDRVSSVTLVLHSEDEEAPLPTIPTGVIGEGVEPLVTEALDVAGQDDQPEAEELAEPEDAQATSEQEKPTAKPMKRAVKAKEEPAEPDDNQAAVDDEASGEEATVEPEDDGEPEEAADTAQDEPPADDGPNYWGGGKAWKK